MIATDSLTLFTWSNFALPASWYSAYTSMSNVCVGLIAMICGTSE